MLVPSEIKAHTKNDTTGTVLWTAVHQSVSHLCSAHTPARLSLPLARLESAEEV